MDKHTISIGDIVLLWVGSDDTQLKPVPAIVTDIVDEHHANITGFPGSGINGFVNIPYSDTPVANTFTMKDVLD